MYLIGICDDEEKELDRIEAFLAEYGETGQAVEYKTERFTDGEALLKRIREGNSVPDLLLLDIFQRSVDLLLLHKKCQHHTFFLP